MFLSMFLSCKETDIHSSKSISMEVYLNTMFKNFCITNYISKSGIIDSTRQCIVLISSYPSLKLLLFRVFLQSEENHRSLFYATSYLNKTPGNENNAPLKNPLKVN